MLRRHNSGKESGGLFGFGGSSSSGGGGGGGLPVVSGLGGVRRRNPNTSLFSVVSSLFEKKNGVDGSAASIHIAPSIKQCWDRASVPTKVTWITFVSTILLIYFGYRTIRYNNTGVVLDCTSNLCSLKLVHLGFKKPTYVELSRHQLLRTEPVKVQKDGSFVSGNANIKVEYTNKNSKKGQYNKGSLNYKGPDDDGNYLSYAIYFRDKQQQQQDENGDSNQYNNDDQDYELQKLYPYTTQTDPGEYRFIVRKQVPALSHSRRRIRTMTQRIDSYIRKRRHKITVRETSGPAWQGVVMLVVGILGFLLTTLLGQFRDEGPNFHSGPGVRRHSSEMNNNKAATSRSSNHVIPPQYEVSTSSGGGGVRRNLTATTTRRR